MLFWRKLFGDHLETSSWRSTRYVLIVELLFVKYQIILNITVYLLFLQPEISLWNTQCVGFCTYFIVPQNNWDVLSWYFSHKLKRYHLTKKAFTRSTIIRYILFENRMSLFIVCPQSQSSIRQHQKNKFMPSASQRSTYYSLAHSFILQNELKFFKDAFKEECSSV